MKKVKISRKFKQILNSVKILKYLTNFGVVLGRNGLCLPLGGVWPNAIRDKINKQ